ncbi:hypothetical protein AAA799P11_00073 [Marine Group I thaumarchaeote SCGC AAA799-P11]|uniref:Uncharacterized protein n=1 Tax=Marine Group I thaumarchaeote SCGC AAA799-P11 TaxID=1502295 RepID=A0A087S3M2_9ARCH|nr:hypothetical protein AAA799P11_00073 [Marine Group I thaumarchaeote SCGC AAA799-P11]
MVQKLQCCSEKPVFLVTYSVSGSEKDYHVCSVCIKKECFSKYIIRRQILENNKKNFQNEQSGIFDESSGFSENFDEHTIQNERDTERGGFVL